MAENIERHDEVRENAEEGQELSAAGASEANADDARQEEHAVPDYIRRELERARREAAKYRTERNELQDQFERFRSGLAQALGIETGDEPDAERLQAQLRQREQELRDLKLRDAFYRQARKLDADEDLAYRWLRGGGELDDLDPSREDFEEQLNARIQTALEENPKLRADHGAPRGARRAPDASRQEPSGGLYTRAELEALSQEEINANWEKVQRSLAALNGM